MVAREFGTPADGDSIDHAGHRTGYSIEALKFRDENSGMDAVAVDWPNLLQPLFMAAIVLCATLPGVAPAWASTSLATQSCSNVSAGGAQLLWRRASVYPVRAPADEKPSQQQRRSRRSTRPRCHSLNRDGRHCERENPVVSKCYHLWGFAQFSIHL